MTWTSGYVAASKASELSPRYVVLLCGDHTELDDSDGLAQADTLITTSNSFDFHPRDRDPLIIYDVNGWELVTMARGSQVPNGGVKEGNPSIITTDLFYVDREQYGGPNLIFPDYSRVAHIVAAFSTHDISDMTLPILSKCDFPSGTAQSVDMRRGHTKFGAINISALDTDSAITKMLSGRRLVNRYMIILGGYDGLPFSEYSMLFVGKVEKLSYMEGRYQFTLAYDFDKINRELWGQLDDAGETSLTGNITASQTTINLQPTITGIYSAGDVDNGDGTFLSGYVWVKDESEATTEYMRVDSATDLITSWSLTVERGALGTVGYAVTDDNQVGYFWSFQGNPIDIMLYIMFTRGKDVRAYDQYDLNAGAAGDASLGLGMDPSDVDISGIENIRDTFFPDDIWIVNVNTRETGLKFIEKHILHPLNCAFYATRAGKMSICHIKPPVYDQENPTELNSSNIIGAPEFSIDRSGVLNNITVEYDHDIIEDEYLSTVIVLDATSQSTYDVDGTNKIEARGVSSLWGGEQIAKRCGNQKTRAFSRPMAPIELSVLFNTGVFIEPGDVVKLNTSLIPDPEIGSTLFNRPVVVMSKEVDWFNGTVDLQVLNPYYTLGRCGLLGPSGMPDWTAASDDEKSRYIWMGDSNNVYSDGAPGNVLY